VDGLKNTKKIITKVVGVVIDKRTEHLPNMSRVAVCKKLLDPYTF